MILKLKKLLVMQEFLLIYHYLEEGNSWGAIKKTVIVLKECKLFVIFDSVSVCTKVLEIPRRMVINMLKGIEFKGFKDEEIKLF